ncbi:hypothetical protein BDV40DRAFT_302644 [Aspergillus tamarii]|uniref:Aldehyde dehydrogenase domain-containing protein n=1 Tax=Aspergillus tamarii TaxID=41984 RepID=A0A5N6UN95_ASPTM|nr:hypothetical protein BDV40DRAFT_302644 [Aspergillus tamarii]
MNRSALTLPHPTIIRAQYGSKISSSLTNSEGSYHDAQVNPRNANPPDIPQLASLKQSKQPTNAQSVAEHAGRHLKKVVLEFGGSDSFIVLEDVDLGAAISRASTGRMMGMGQTCASPKRFIVVGKERGGFFSQGCRGAVQNPESWGSDGIWHGDWPSIF